MSASRLLFLLRHAKSSWDDPSLADHDRPLAPRGRRAAALMADHLRRQRIAVSLVLCSSARRAQETLELVKPTGEVSIEDALYAASAAQLLERLHHLPADPEAVMLIGHNPAIQELARSLVRTRATALEGKFPTGALATLVVRSRWNSLAAGSATLLAFVRPRDLQRHRSR